MAPLARVPGQTLQVFVRNMTLTIAGKDGDEAGKKSFFFFFFDTKFLNPNAQACFENPANRLVSKRTSKASEVQGRYLFDT